MKSKYCLIVSCCVALIVLSSCNNDPCDVAHTVVDGECIPDYVFPQNKNHISGDRFYHTQYGVIIFKDDNWYNDKGSIITELNAKKQ